MSKRRFGERAESARDLVERPDIGDVGDADQERDLGAALPQRGHHLLVAAARRLPARRQQVAEAGLRPLPHDARKGRGMTDQGPRQERAVAEDRRQERLARRLGFDGAARLGDRRAGGAEGVVPLGEAQLGQPGIGRFGYRSGPVEECERFHWSRCCLPRGRAAAASARRVERPSPGP